MTVMRMMEKMMKIHENKNYPVMVIKVIIIAMWFGEKVKQYVGQLSVWSEEKMRESDYIIFGWVIEQLKRKVTLKSL